MINERQRLSVGAPPAQKIFGIVFGVIFALAGAAFVLLPFVVDGWLGSAFGAADDCPSSSEISGIPPDLLPPSVRECVANGSWFNGGDGFGAMRLIGLFGIPFVLLGLYLALSALRTAAWIEGTTVTVRGALRTRTADLSSASVAAGARSYRRDTIQQAPTLVADGVTIPLSGAGLAQLPSAELRRLAEALTTNRDQDARAVATQLRTMADNPLGLTSR